MGQITLPDPSNTSALNYNMRKCDSDKYYFYHMPDSPDNAPELYKHLLCRAISQIDIWDPYFNVSSIDKPDDTSIFDSLVQSNIKVNILTIRQKKSDYFDSIKSKLLYVLPDNVDNISFYIRCIDSGDIDNKKWQFHDRILIIDRTDVFLVGASIGYNISPHRSFGIYKIYDVNTMSFILNMFQQYWQQGVQNELTLTNIR